MLLRARCVVPVSSEPIKDGIVSVEGNRIVFVGAASDLRQAPDLDLGDATLLPGLVNAHCHLEHSGLKGKTSPGRRFTEWVREIARLGTGVEPSAAAGIERLRQTGTTTVADHCNPETPHFEAPFRRIPFWEVLGASHERAEASLQKAEEMAKQHGGYVTPHSVYAVHKDVLKEILDHNPSHPPLTLRGGASSPPLKVRGGWGVLWSIHLLESSDEDQFLHTGSGPLADYVLERGGERSAPSTPLSYLQPGALLIHGNYLNASEIAVLHDRGVSVIHCPGSHRFFGHRRFPLEDLQQAGVPIALGTDSLASNDDLSMFREMRLLKESYPELDEAVVLKLATIEGARALGMEREIGSIEVGKKADLIAVHGNVFEANEICFSMIDGKLCTTR